MFHRVSDEREHIWLIVHRRAVKQCLSLLYTNNKAVLLQRKPRDVTIAAVTIDTNFLLILAAK